MSVKRAEFPDSLLLNDMNPVNRKYCDDFRLYLTIFTMEVTVKSYLIILDKLFRFPENWSINFEDYTAETVEKFIGAYKAPSKDRINGIISAINKMADYFKQKSQEIFDRNFLNDLKPETDYDNKNIPAKALSQHELNLVKEYCKDESHRLSAYVFAVLYYLGIKKNDFGLLNPSTYDIEQPLIIDGEVIEIPDEVKVAYEYVRGFYIPESKILEYLEHIAHFLQKKGIYEKEKPFSVNDIKLTRRRFFLKCPCCEKSIENTAENWVLVQFDDVPSRTLACSKCKGVKNHA